MHVSSWDGHIPWVCSVWHFGGMYLVLEPFVPAMCSTWYRVIFSLKSVAWRNRLMTFSVVMPTFRRNAVSANLPMWDKCFPASASW